MRFNQVTACAAKPLQEDIVTVVFYLGDEMKQKSVSLD
jgi:hypothetical protein